MSAEHGARQYGATLCMYTNFFCLDKLVCLQSIEVLSVGAGGRFLVAYQIIALLALYLLVTAVVDQSATIALAHQTRLLLSLGARPPSPASYLGIFMSYDILLLLLNHFSYLYTVTFSLDTCPDLREMMHALHHSADMCRRCGLSWQCYNLTCSPSVCASCAGGCFWLASCVCCRVAACLLSGYSRSSSMLSQFWFQVCLY